MKSLPKSLILFAATAAALSGCGSSGISGVPDTTVQGQDNGQIVTPVDTGYGTGAYPLSFTATGIPNPDPSHYVFSTSTVSAPLRTDSMLKVLVTLDPASQNHYPDGTYSNYTANYTCATIAVTLQMEINGVYEDFATVITDRITAKGTSGCAGSSPSQTIDFSAYMTPGHGNMKIKTQAVTSDVNCTAYANHVGTWPWNYGQVCASNPMQSIYQYHVVNGKIQAQVNGTNFGN